MADPHHLLFGEVFLDYIRGLFFQHSDKRFSSKDIHDAMPSFFKDQEMVNAAIHILLLKEDVIQLPLTADTDEYQANPKAIESLKRNIELDRKIKEYTKENLVAQKFPLKWWWAISLLTIFFSGLASYTVNKLNGSSTQPIIRTEQTQPTIQAQQDTQVKSDTSLLYQDD